MSTCVLRQQIWGPTCASAQDLRAACTFTCRMVLASSPCSETYAQDVRCASLPCKAHLLSQLEELLDCGDIGSHCQIALLPRHDLEELFAGGILCQGCALVKRKPVAQQCSAFEVKAPYTTLQA